MRRSAAAPGLGTEAVRALDRAGILVDDVAVLQPSLDDVFFELTGHPTAPIDEPVAQDGGHTGMTVTAPVPSSVAARPAFGPHFAHAGTTSSS